MPRLWDWEWPRGAARRGTAGEDAAGGVPGIEEGRVSTGVVPAASSATASGGGLFDVVLRRDGGDGGAQRPGGKRWRSGWRAAAAALAATACVCALVSWPAGRVDSHGPAFRAGAGGADGAGGTPFELVEAKLDAAILVRDRNIAHARGWSRAQALAQREPMSVASTPAKAPGFRVLTEQMKSLHVLRQKLARMVAREGHLAHEEIRAGGLEHAASSDSFSWPSSHRIMAEQRPPAALSGATHSSLYVVNPQQEEGERIQLQEPAASPVSTTAEALSAGRQISGKGPPTLPADESTRLWDFPDIKKYQVIHSRRNFWKEMKKINDAHMYESEPFSWPQPTPDTSSDHQWVRTASRSIENTVGDGASGYANAFPAKFDWPQPQGASSAFPPSASPNYVKPGSLLKRGDIMPKTRPPLFWSQSCSLYLCPLDTPHKERAYAWKYCMNHFYTNAEKRYCFTAILSPPKPPPSCPPLPDPAHGHVIVPPDSEEGFTPGRVKVGFPVHIVCDDGFQVAGNADPKCMQDGSYDHPGKCVEVVCPPYEAPAHGSVEPTTSTEVGQHVNISCDEGYDIEGDASPVCREDGTYSAGATCEPRMCDPYAPPEHGSVTPSGPVQEGESVHIQCDPGYEPEEPDKVDVVCQDGWGNGTRCIPIMCPPYVVPEHGIASDGAPHRVGETVAVHCDEGFEPVAGHETEAQKRQGGLVAGGRGREGADVIQSNVVANVVDGVKTIDGIVCGYDKEYHPPVQCERIVPKCAPYDAPPHASVSDSGEIEVGKCVDIICDDDFQLVPGTESRACCVEEGEGVHYEPYNAECEPLQQCPVRAGGCLRASFPLHVQQNCHTPSPSLAISNKNAIMLTLCGTVAALPAAGAWRRAPDGHHARG